MSPQDAGAAAPPDDPVELWVKRLRARYPGRTRAIGEEELEARVRAALLACPIFEITEPRDVFRTLALRVLITPEQQRSKLAEGTLLRVISNLDWSPKKRLDFIYEHLIDRPVADDEPELGPSFIPRRRPA